VLILTRGQIDVGVPGLGLQSGGLWVVVVNLPVIHGQAGSVEVTLDWRQGKALLLSDWLAATEAWNLGCRWLARCNNCWCR
jgi:hypothetical protein